MKKDFHVFFLFALILLFAANAAWADNLTLKTNKAGEYYIKMPKGNTDYFNIDVSTPPFKIKASKDGWRQNYFDAAVHGTLVLTAPEGYAIRASGYLYCGSLKQCEINIYDGNVGGSLLVHDQYYGFKAGVVSNNGVTQSVSNMMTFDANSHGLKDVTYHVDVEVTILPPKSVTLNQSVGGTAEISPSISHQGETIYVTGTPDKGYLLQGLEIRDENGTLLDIPVESDWYSTATFTMPDANITVTPVFSQYHTAEDGFFVNMSKMYGTKEVQIPATMKSFKVYDNGVKNGNSYNGNYYKNVSYLVLTAPPGRLLQVTGNAEIDAGNSNGKNDSLKIYDGLADANVLLYNYEGRYAQKIDPFRSSDNRMSVYMRPYHSDGTRDYEQANGNFGLDLTVEVVSASTISLSENDTLTYKEVSRKDPLTIYSNLKDSKDFYFDLQSRHAVGSMWSNWEEMRLNYECVDCWPVYEDEHSASGYEHRFTIPAELLHNNYEYMEFRYVLTPINENDKLVTSERIYTDAVKVRLMNKIKVTTLIGNTDGGYYSMWTKNSTTIEKDHLIPYGTVVNVQALPPEGYKFNKWENGEIQKKRTITLVSDTSLQAFFTPNTDDLTLKLFISNDGSNTYTAENSPLEVNVTNTSNFEMTASITASEGKCTKDMCYAYVVMRKEGSDEWIKVGSSVKANSNNGFTSTVTRGWGNDVNGSRFEFKMTVEKADGTIVESNSVFANLFRTFRFLGCIDVKDHSVNSDEACGVIVENELGDKQTLREGDQLTLQYGSLLKLHPLYPYNMDFFSWKDAASSLSASELYGPDVYLSKDYVYEFPLESNFRFTLGLTPRTLEVIRFLPDGWENDPYPYSGMSDFNLTLDGYDGLLFASDTTFYIEKEGLSEKFAVNKLDSAFTPGDYTITIKLVHRKNYDSERDSLWACYYPASPQWIDNPMTDYAVMKIACTETTPAVYYYRKDFTVTGTVSFAGFTTNGGNKVLFGAVIDGVYRGSDAINITAETQVDTVVFNREFSQSGFSTIMLPFDVNVSDIVGLRSVIEFSKMYTDGEGNPAVGFWYVWCDAQTQTNLENIAKENGTNTFEHCNDAGYSDGVLHAYTPYMIEMPSAGLQFKDKVTLKVTPEKTEVRGNNGNDDWVFRGTTEKKVWTDEETKDGNVWAYAGQVTDASEYVGQFVMLGEGASAPPLRAYMVKDPVKPQSIAPYPYKPSYVAKSATADAETASIGEMNVVILSRDNNGENGKEPPTVIGKFDVRTGELHLNRTTRTFDLNGRNVGEGKKAKGAYYKSNH